MRQDPDVILVGEIRDLETVDIALQAALTGHFVLTTLHTNDAAGTVARLVALGAKLSNIGPAIKYGCCSKAGQENLQKVRRIRENISQRFRKTQKGLQGNAKKYKIAQTRRKNKNPQSQGVQRLQLYRIPRTDRNF
jgi:type II secretory ATPase GspE/PulE/Tfp pilus assembly ATPase PilB-like protein